MARPCLTVNLLPDWVRLAFGIPLIARKADLRDDIPYREAVYLHDPVSGWGQFVFVIAFERRLRDG